MSSRQAKRQTARAVDELRRGYAITLKNNDSSLSVQVAERMISAPGALPATLILPPARAAQLALGAGKGAASLALPAGKEALFAALMSEPAPALGNIKAAPASELEEAALALVRETGFLPAALVSTEKDADQLVLHVDDLRATLAVAPAPLSMSDPVPLPLAGAEDARVITFRDGAGDVHLAVLVGAPDKENAVLARVHSSCLTGDLLGSLRCDCGDQLHLALAAIVNARAGVLLYLNQEGRGIGLANKLHAYRMQDLGLDTVEANHALGFADDERDFALAAHMFKSLGITKIRLLTNNPVKQEVLEHSGITVTERLPLKADATAHNKEYLAAKAAKLRHQL